MECSQNQVIPKLYKLYCFYFNQELPVKIIELSNSAQ